MNSIVLKVIMDHCEHLISISKDKHYFFIANNICTMLQHILVQEHYRGLVGSRDW